MHPAAKRNDAASMTKAHTSPTLPASRPAPAKPIAVDPKLAMDRNEFAAASSSSLAISGIRLSWAGSKNCLTPALTRSRRNRPSSAIASMPMTTAMSATTTAWTRQVARMTPRRSWRSTNTPASSPTTRLGRTVTMSVSPTARVDSVTRQT